MAKKSALCFLTNSPSQHYIDMVKHLNNEFYQVLIFVDKGTKNDDVIYIDGNIVAENGFKGSVYYFPNRACSRDKALFYFRNIGNVSDMYDSIWFIEEDVFVPHLETIVNIDKKYDSKKYDLLSKSNMLFTDKANMVNKWYWNHIFSQTTLQPPFAASMVCAIRVSPRLLDVIHLYVAKYHSLFLDEVMFNTLALRNGFQIACPAELSTIVYRRNWKRHEIKKTNLYHPVKSLKGQLFLRR